MQGERRLMGHKAVGGRQAIIAACVSMVLLAAYLVAVVGGLAILPLPIVLTAATVSLLALTPCFFTATPAVLPASSSTQRPRSRGRFTLTGPASPQANVSSATERARRRPGARRRRRAILLAVGILALGIAA